MKSILIILSVLIIPVFHCYVVTYDDNGHLLGSKKCTYGPAYWCHNITQAKECGAMAHCISKVWEDQKLPDDNDDVCQVCKEMVKEARDQLLSNQTQDELRQVLEGSCALIPLKPIATECKSVMDEFMPELVDALASRMDPIVVCSISGLCNSIRIDEMLNEMKPISMVTCEICTGQMKTYFENLKRLPREQLQMKMLENCGYLSSYSDSCRMAIIEEFGNIYEQIQKFNAREFCNLFGICKENDKNAVAIYNEDLGCDFCKQLVNYVRKWMTDNTTKEEFEKIVQGLCRQCGSHKQECIDFYHQYGGEIYRLILDDLDAESFCERVGVCPGYVQGGFFKQPEPIWTILHSEKPMLPLVAGERITGADEKNALALTPECTFCEYVVHELQNYIEDPSTERNVKEFVDHLCDKYLPKEMSDQCEQFVTDYGDTFLALIGDEFVPNQVCPKLNLCPAAAPTEVVQKAVIKDILPTCGICEFTVTKLLDLIGQNHTKESIESATDRVCKMMPGKYVSKCESFMTEYGDRVLEMILIEGTSHEICAALHLCLFAPENMARVALTRYSASSANPREDTKCILCEYVISTLATKIKENATEEEIKTEVEQVCKYFPKTVTKNCREFVETYGDLVIKYLADDLDPDIICTEIQLCTPKIMEYALNLNRCELCTVIADYLSMKMEDPKFEQNGVDVVANKFCPLLRNLKGECKEMIEDYGPYIMSLLAQEEDKEKVCKVIDIC